MQALRCFSAALVMCGASLLAGAQDTMPWAFNGQRAEGYTIDLSSVEPVPGTPLVAGRTVEFKVTLSYSLSIAKKGVIVLVFQDEKNGNAKPAGPPVTHAVDEGSGTVTLTDTIAVPRRAKELRLFIPLVPEGIETTYGEVVIRYPIRKK